MSQNLSKRAKLKALEGKLNLLKAFGIIFEDIGLIKFRTDTECSIFLA